MQQTIDQITQDHYDQLINEHQAAEFLSHSVRTLQGWRVRGGGPKYAKISGKSIRYRRRDLIAWTENLMVSNTSQAITY